MRTHSRPNRNTRIVVVGSIPITDDIPTREVELITAAITSNVKPIERPDCDYDKGSPHAPAQP